MKQLRFGIVGFGQIAEMVHLRTLKTLAGVEVVAIAESDPQRRAVAGRQAPQAVLFEDYGTMLKDIALDAVILCLPTALHAAASLTAFEHGLHVYLEKPIGVNLNEAQAVVQAWEASGCVGMVGFNYRFNPFYQRLRAEVQSRENLGRIMAARTCFITAGPTVEWKRHSKTGGGVLLDLASHHIDLTHFIFGQSIRAVTAGLQSRQNEGDTLTLTLELASGTFVQILAASRLNAVDTFEVYGEQLAINLDRLEQRFDFVDPHHVAGPGLRYKRALQAFFQTPYLLDSFMRPSREQSYVLALQHFCNCIREARMPSPNLMDGLRSSQIVAAAQESVDLDQQIIMDEAIYAG